MTFGQKLLKYRTQHRLNQTQLSGILGISRQQLNRIERGKKTPPLNRVKDVVDKLGYDYNYWLSDKEAICERSPLVVKQLTGKEHKKLNQLLDNLNEILKYGA